MEEEIIYTFNPEAFKEFLYNTRRNSIKKASIFFPVSVIIFLTVYIISLRLPAVSFVIVLAAMLVIGCGIFLFSEIYEHNKFKTGVENYTTSMKDKKMVISVKDGFIKLETDEERIIESFKDLRLVTIRDDCIRLKGESGTSYHFIAKSMNEKSFKQLKALIETNMI